MGWLLQKVATNAKGRACGSEGMIFVSDGCTKQGHETIAQELIERTLVAVYDSQREFKKTVQNSMHRLGADALGEGGRPDEIAEQDSYLLTLALHGGA